MEGGQIVESITSGAIDYPDRKEAIAGVEWIAHPAFRGVFLKHLVKGADTRGRLSCHVVRVDPGCMLDEHIHGEQWELHEVIGGEGQCLLDSKEIPYFPGSMAVIPQGTRHRVVAGSQGLVLLAKFFPALL